MLGCPLGNACFATEQCSWFAASFATGRPFGCSRAVPCPIGDCYVSVRFANVQMIPPRETALSRSTALPRTDAAIRWLLEGDPAIRWQALRDLVGAAERTVDRERKRVARDGWGARLLARQDAAGTWAAGRSADSGLYTPKWTSTTYTM